MVQFINLTEHISFTLLKVPGLSLIHTEFHILCRFLEDRRFQNFIFIFIFAVIILIILNCAGFHVVDIWLEKQEYISTKHTVGSAS